MITHKKYYLQIIIVLLFCILAVVIYNVLNGGLSETQPKPQPIDTRTSRVYIDNLSEYANYFDSSRHQSIEETLYSFTLGSVDKPDLFTGSIRPGSLSRSTTASGTSSRVLIDVFPVNITYSMEVNSPNKGSFSPISIVCAPPDQRLDKSVPCITTTGLG